MKLLELYALSTGLKIGNQFLLEKFYPISNPHYITIQSGSGMNSKNYPYFTSVIELIVPFLKQNNIDILQLGGKDDIPVKYTINLLGKTDIHQTNYLLSRSLLHIGNDSFCQHRAGFLNIPQIDVFGPTAQANHAPYNKSNKSFFIESHRNNNTPSFSSRENSPTIFLIPPEKIAHCIYKIFDIDYKPSIETFYIGSLYNLFSIEWIPDGILDPNFIKDLPITVRLDLYFDEKNMAIVALNGRKINIVTDKPIDINLLNDIKSNVLGINYEININDDINYIKELKKLGIKIRFFSKESDKDKISKIRFKFFDQCLIEYMIDRTKENFLEDCAKYLNKSLDKDFNFSTLKYRSNKFIISNGLLYTSKATWRANLPVNNFEQNISQVIDNEDFWCDYQFYNIFESLI